MLTTFIYIYELESTCWILHMPINLLGTVFQNFCYHFHFSKTFCLHVVVNLNFLLLICAIEFGANSMFKLTKVISWQIFGIRGQGDIFTSFFYSHVEVLLSLKFDTKHTQLNKQQPLINLTTYHFTNFSSVDHVFLEKEREREKNMKESGRFIVTKDTKSWQIMTKTMRRQS